MTFKEDFSRRSSWLRGHASKLLRQIASNVRRSVRQREVAAHGACLLLLIIFVAFDVQSPLAFLLALGMLWALSHEQRRDRSSNARERLTENVDRNAEEAPWK